MPRLYAVLTAMIGIVVPVLSMEFSAELTALENDSRRQATGLNDD